MNRADKNRKPIRARNPPLSLAEFTSAMRSAESKDRGSTPVGPGAHGKRKLEEDEDMSQEEMLAEQQRLFQEARRQMHEKQQRQHAGSRRQR